MSALARGVILEYRGKMPDLLVLDIDLFDDDDQRLLGDAFARFPGATTLLFVPQGNITALSREDAKATLEQIIEAAP